MRLFSRLRQWLKWRAYRNAMRAAQTVLPVIPEGDDLTLRKDWCDIGPNLQKEKRSEP